MVCVNLFPIGALQFHGREPNRTEPAGRDSLAIDDLTGPS
jgi:hypothetical protein